MQLFRKLTPLFIGRTLLLAVFVQSFVCCISHRNFLITFWFGLCWGSGTYNAHCFGCSFLFSTFSTAALLPFHLTKDCNYHPLVFFSPKLKLKSLVFLAGLLCHAMPSATLRVCNLYIWNLKTSPLALFTFNFDKFLIAICHWIFGRSFFIRWLCFVSR